MSKQKYRTYLVKGNQKELGLFQLAKPRLSVLFIVTFWRWENMRKREELLKFKDSSKQNAHDFFLKKVS